MGILLNPELEHRIAAKVQSGRYHSADEVIEESLALLEARDAEPKSSIGTDAAAVSEMIAAFGAQVPEEAWSHVPTDLARNTDHYLYGSPRNSE